jgi:hypothetical protein
LKKEEEGISLFIVDYNVQATVKDIKRKKKEKLKASTFLL